MSEEENKVLEYFKNKQVYDMELVFNYIPILLNIIEGLQTKVNTGIEIIKELKEIEKSYQEENGKLRVELEQEKEKNNNLIKQLQEQNTEIQDISRQLRQEKEKNKELEKQLKLKNGDIDYISNKINNHFIDDVTLKNNYISKDKIKEKIEETNKENEIKGYTIDKLKELLEEK